MKFNFKWLIYLPILFFFLPGFSFYMPGLKGLYYFYYISLYIAIIAFFIFDRKFLINKFLSICKNTPLLYFMIFLLFIIVNSLILSLFGITSIGQTIRYTIMRIILGIMPTIVYFIYIIKRHLGLEKFIKIFMFMFWINLILSFIAYIGRWFDISIINSCFDFLNNKRLLDMQYGGTAEQTAEIYFLGHKRLSGLYEEPGFLGRFLYLFLPLIYTFSKTNQQLYKNFMFDKIFKKTVIPFTWITLLLTQSAMSIVFAVIITIIYYFKNILSLLKKYFLIIIPMVLLITTLVISIDFSDTFVVRIINVITNIHSFEEFILIEPSLATRVVGYLNTFRIFLDHIFTGIGVANIHSYIYDKYLSSPVPLTPEIITRTQFAIQMGDKPFVLSGFIYAILAESGLFGFAIITFFFIKTFLCIFNSYKICNKETYQYLILKSLTYLFVSFSLPMVYDLTLKEIYLHLIIVLCAVYIYDSKFQSLEEKSG